jgi:hypothetical protein
MPWGSPPNYDFPINHETDIEGVLFYPCPSGQSTFPASASNPATLNAADPHQAQLLLELRKIHLERKAIEVQQQILLQEWYRGQWNINSVSNDIQNSAQELSSLFVQQTTEDPVTSGSLLQLQYNNAMPISVHGDSTESILFGTSPVTELSSEPSDPNLIHNSYGSASSDGGIWHDGNYLLPSNPAFSSVTANGDEVPITVFPVNETETMADRFTAPSQVCIPPLVPKRRRSVPDRPGFACLSSIEQESSVRKEKKGRTKEECDNTKEVKELGSCFRCRLRKKQVSCIYFPLHGQHFVYHRLPH